MTAILADVEPPCTADPEGFYPENGDRRKGLLSIEDHAADLAAAYCDHCPLRVACLQAALDLEAGLGKSSRFGVWAGTTPDQRALMEQEATG